MTFSELYGTELDRALGSADRTVLFTTARRKAAINAAQLEWVKRTECLRRSTTVTLVTTTQEYDLEATITDFLAIAKEGVSIKIVEGSNTRYIEGDDLTVTTIAELNTTDPGWRAVSASTPTHVYQVRNGGTVNVGLHPAPSFSSGTWTLILPYVAIPTDLSADADVPFTVSSNAILSLRPWHVALVYYAAHDLEQFRKDPAREGVALKKFDLEVERFLVSEKPKQGTHVRFTRNYRQRTATPSWRLDPRFN